MKKDITAIFCLVYDFCKFVDDELKNSLLLSIHQMKKNTSKPTRTPCLCMAEIITIILLYQQSPCKNFKYFYTSYLQLYKTEFNLPSYNRFIELESRALVYICMLMKWYCSLAERTGIGYIDSSSLAVCHNKRISKNKVFRGCATLAKTTKGWFYGLKLHLITNERGEIINLKFTTGNTDDRTPVPQLAKGLTGLLFGDKGYIKQELFTELYTKGLKLVTGIKSTMKNKFMSIFEKILLKKRSIIETIFSVLKCNFELEHTRHRSVWNAFVHLISVLITYSMKRHKPSIKYSFVIPN